MSINSSNKYSSAILPNGKVNVSLIQREIAQDLSADARYHAEDCMKKRAIHMSKDYDEFKSFVSCSQLKPVPSHEMGQLFVARRTENQQHHRARSGRVNPSCTRTAPSVISSMVSSPFTTDGSSRVGETSREIPTNVAQLEREWKRYCGSPADTLSYITMPVSAILCPSSVLDSGFTERLRISPEQISQSLCRVEMDATVFGDILEALDCLLSAEFDNIRDEARSFTHRWMLALPHSGRFRINVAFLSKKQRKFIVTIFEDLQVDESVNREGLRPLRKQYE